MSDDPGTPSRQSPGDLRPGRTLDRAPADRYSQPAAANRREPGVTRGGLRGIPGALLVATVGGVVIVILNVVLTVTTGLVAVAAVTGYLTGQALQGSAQPRTVGPAGAAAAIAVLAVAAAALATWVVALVAQGGAIGPLDYLAETMGLLLPLQGVAAAVAAWLGAR